MESIIKQDRYIGALIKWGCLLVCLSACVFSINTLHQQKLQKLAMQSELLLQKASIITQLHEEMLTITRNQYLILHASDHEQVRQLISNLSVQVTDYLLHYHQLEQIAESSDADLLKQYKFGFKQWHKFNQDLLAYANVVADAGIINSLNMVSLAFTQLDSEPDKPLLLITQQDVKDQQDLSN